MLWLEIQKEQKAHYTKEFISTLSQNITNSLPSTIKEFVIANQEHPFLEESLLVNYS